MNSEYTLMDFFIKTDNTDLLKAALLKVLRAQPLSLTTEEIESLNRKYRVVTTVPKRVGPQGVQIKFRRGLRRKNR